MRSASSYSESLTPITAPPPPSRKRVSRLCEHVLGITLPTTLAVRDDVTALVVRVREEALPAVSGDAALAAAGAAR